MSEWMDLVLFKLLDWGVPFVAGLLVRKKVARFIIIMKKRLFNDFVAVSIIAVRFYSPVDEKELGYELYNDIKTKIPSPKLLDIFPNGMRIAVPVFGNLRVSLNRIVPEEDIEHEEVVERIKVTLSPESPVRLGTREIHLLNDFAQYIEILFAALEKSVLQKATILQNYTILEAPRIKYFAEEKAFEFEDSALGTSVQATPNKVTVTVGASTQIAKAAGKYLLV